MRPATSIQSAQRVFDAGAGSAALLVVTSAIAGWLPARRASKRPDELEHDLRIGIGQASTKLARQAEHGGHPVRRGSFPLGVSHAPGGK